MYNALGAYFYDNGPNSTTTQSNGTIALTPKISYTNYGAIDESIDWVRLSGVFVADSTYDNIIIGGTLNNASCYIGPFSPNTSSFAEYYIDNIQVREAREILNDFALRYLCAGAGYSLPYKLASPVGYFNSTNTFYAQLSDINGSFASPLEIGSLSTNDTGSIFIDIPDTITSGTGYRIRIVSSNGIDTSYDNSVDIRIDHAPSVTASSNSPICQYDTLRLTGTNIIDAEYTWIGPNNYHSNEREPKIKADNVNQGGMYKLYTKIYGCRVLDTTMVTVNPTPIVSATSNGPICNGQPLTLTASGTDLTNASFNWTGPNSFSSTTQNPTIITTTPASTGTYTIIATIGNCSDTATVTTTNYFNDDTTTVSGNSPVCEGETINLSAIIPTVGANFYWAGPNSFTSSLSNPSINAVNAAAQTGKYIVYTSINTCIQTDTVDILVNEKPVAIATGNTPVCPGTIFQLTGTSSLTGSSYNWTGPGTFTSNVASPSWASATYSNAGTYTLIASKNGCSDTADVSMSVYITTATPAASINNPACEHDLLQLNATCATPGVTYTWTGAAGFNSNVQNPRPATILNFNNADFVVHAELNGCVSLPDTVRTTVISSPYIGNYASPNDTVCSGTTVTFVTVPVGAIASPVYNWYKNNIMIPGAGANIYATSSLISNDSFYCTTSFINQCGNTNIITSNKIGVTLMPVITIIGVTISSTPIVPLPGSITTFIANVTGGGYTPSFQWKKNGIDIPGANAANYVGSNLAPYDNITCCVVSSDPCAVPTTACSDAMVINFPTTVGEATNDDAITLYPNPNDGSFKVKIQKSKVEKIEVVNVSGQVVYQTEPETAQAEYTINLPSQLPSGTYMLRVYDGVQYYRQSFTVSK